MDFNLPGECLGFMFKLERHIVNGNENRIKDYIIGGYDTFSSLKYQEHPCFGTLNKGMKFLKQKGWMIYLGTWKNLGTQIILKSPNEEYFHTHFKH